MLADIVALFTRAWIEMAVLRLQVFFCSVALFTRAWIEIRFWLLSRISCQVALFTRAWIEIYFLGRILKVVSTSPSSRGRGLKSILATEKGKSFKSPSSRGRGLKSQVQILSNIKLSGRPLHEGVD